MAQVAMTIASRVYRVACDEGEEDHLRALAQMVDGKVADMREKFGEMGDQRLTVMAAVTLADELAESLRRIGALEAELSDLRGDAVGASRDRDEWISRVAASLGEAAARLELVTQDLNGAIRGEE
jgi:cell division protein ZapA